MARYVADGEIDPKDQRAALISIEKRVSALLEKLDLLDHSSRQSLGWYYPRDPLEHEDNLPTIGSDILRRDIEHLRRIQIGLEHAAVGVDNEVRQGRPAAPEGLAVACRAFICVYEAYTGQRFTYDYRPGVKRTKASERLDAFPSVFAQFVAEAVWAVFPDATEANLSTAMRNFKHPDDEPPETD